MVQGQSAVSAPRPPPQELQMGERSWLSPGAGGCSDVTSACASFVRPLPPSGHSAARLSLADPPGESVSLPSQPSRLNQRSSCPWAARAKYGKAGGPKHRRAFSHSYGGWTFKTKELAGPCWQRTPSWPLPGSWWWLSAPGLPWLVDTALPSLPRGVFPVSLCLFVQISLFLEGHQSNWNA